VKKVGVMLIVLVFFGTAIIDCSENSLSLRAGRVSGPKEVVFPPIPIIEPIELDCHTPALKEALWCVLSNPSSSGLVVVAYCSFGEDVFSKVLFGLGVVSCLAHVAKDVTNCYYKKKEGIQKIQTSLNLNVPKLNSVIQETNGLNKEVEDIFTHYNVDDYGKGFCIKNDYERKKIYDFILNKYDSCESRLSMIEEGLKKQAAAKHRLSLNIRKQ